MMAKNYSKILEKYLSQVDRYLTHMSISEKTDILSELKSSFYERMNSGQTEESIIAEMESPQELAMNYLGESVAESSDFSFKRLMMVIGFYSLASMAWVSIIPTLGALAFSFFIASGISVFAGVLGMLKDVFIHVPLLSDVKMMFFMREITGIPALLIGLMLGIIFVVLGIVCWKGTIGMIQYLREKAWKLNHEGV